MIEIIPTLLTPAMLALAPLNTEVPTIKYDWNTQTASAFDAEGEVMQFQQRQTWRNSTSMARGSAQYIADDLESD